MTALLQRRSRTATQSIHVSVLREKGYHDVDHSPSLPEIRIQEIPRFLDIGIARGELAMIKRFRKWIRKSRRSKGKK
ncbi:MAG: hypothetical protein L0Y71_22970 [Gemmataceae bacterium]|nr:hypothetical protein [Gemmataceae bacterium]